MPLFKTPDIQDLEDHFFGSGAFGYGWFDTASDHFPAVVEYYEETDSPGPLGDGGDNAAIETKIFTAEDFIEGIKKYAEISPDRDFHDLIEDMDSVDVDNVIQLMFWGEVRLS